MNDIVYDAADPRDSGTCANCAYYESYVHVCSLTGYTKPTEDYCDDYVFEE